MTPLEFRAASRALAKEIGSKAEISSHFSDYCDEPLSALVYPRGSFGNGRVHDASFTVRAFSFEDLLNGVRAKWIEYAEAHRQRSIREMALEIIRITAEHGECTDAQLRGSTKFSHAEIGLYGEAACADANDIAGRGPFSIVTMGGANAEAA